MSTRRRIGVSLATTEAARRQLMQPVQCWERAWVPADASFGSNIKVWKWVKTEKVQTFSDDEGEVDQPLAPLPDEPEALDDGDEDMDADEQAPSVEPISRADSELVVLNDEAVQANSPRPPHPLSMSFSAPEPDGANEVNDDLKPLEVPPSLEADLPDLTLPDEVENDLDLSHLGPDGTAFEADNDLSQLEPEDSLLGGPVMDQSEDPFDQDQGEQT